jgi:hypothetical protein
MAHETALSDKPTQVNTGQMPAREVAREQTRVLSLSRVLPPSALISPLWQLDDRNGGVLLKHGQCGRNIFVEEKLHAACDMNVFRSRSAAKAKQARMSS